MGDPQDWQEEEAVKRLLLLTIVLLAATPLLLGAMRSLSHVVYFTAGQAAALGLLGSVTTVNKFGHNADSDTTEDSVWDGSDFGGPIRCFTVPGASAAALYISSDDEADAGLSVTVQAINAAWESVTVVQLLGADNGATGTEFVQLGSVDLLRVNRAFPTSDAAAGNIYIHIDSVDAAVKDGVPDTILTDIVAMIDLAEQQTMQACYTVPVGHNALVTRIEVDVADTAANATGTFRLRAATDGGAAKTKVDMLVAEDTFRTISYDPPMALPEKTDIELTNVSAANGATVKGRFDIILVPNTL